MKKYLITVKDSSGNNYTVYNDDPRYTSGQLFPAAAKHFIDCPIHGRKIIRNQKRLKSSKIPDEFKIYCPECRDYYLSDDFIVDNNFKGYTKKSLRKIFFVSSNQQTKKYFDKYMPHFSKVISNHPLKEIKNIRFSDLIYFTKENINEVPKCVIANCNNPTNITASPSSFGFTIYCDKHQHNYYTSTGERELEKFISSIYNDKIIKRYKSEKFEIDIYLENLNIGIEFNGLYWHGSDKKGKNYHLDKWNYFNDKNIKLITIWEDDWKYKRDLIESIIRNNIHKNLYKINARECKIKNVNSIIKGQFLKENHLQGNCPSSINLGLYKEEKLVSLMTFGKSRMILGSNKNKNNTWELLRFCSLKNYSVRGAASKLFKNFISNHEFDSIISYANKDISKGDLYETLGFNMKSESLNYWWAYQDRKYHRSNFMKHKLVKEGFSALKTANEIMKEKGFWKIFGNGNIKYEYTKKARS